MSKQRATSFAHGERGKYAGMVDVYTGASDNPLAVTKLKIKPTRRRNPPPLVVAIDDDLRASFPDADAVNLALRTLVRAAER